MDLKKGRRVKVTPGLDLPGESGVVACIKESAHLKYPVQVRWPDNGYTMCAYSELEPICEDCGHVASAHGEGAGKCLFGPGVWK